MPAVLITGSSRGIGLEFVRQYATNGWSVFAACRTPANAAQLMALATQFKTVHVEIADVTDRASIYRLSEKLKNETIDVLINNAGIFSGTGRNGSDFPDDNADASQAFGSLDDVAWLRVFATNSVAPLLITEAFLPQLERSANGKVANISSRMGSMAIMRSLNKSGDLAYRTSKAALNAGMCAIAPILHKKGIAIANFHPGWVKTDMGREIAPLSPEESVRGMRNLIERLSLNNSGSFWAYDGSVLPW